MVSRGLWLQFRDSRAANFNKVTTRQKDLMPLTHLENKAAFVKVTLRWAQKHTRLGKRLKDSRERERERAVDRPVFMSVGQLRSQRHGSNHFRSIDAAQTIDYEPLRYICILGKCWGCSLLSSAFFMLLKLVALAMSAHSSGDAFTPRNSPSLLTTLSGSCSANNSA